MSATNPFAEGVHDDRPRDPPRGVQEETTPLAEMMSTRLITIMSYQLNQPLKLFCGAVGDTFRGSQSIIWLLDTWT